MPGFFEALSKLENPNEKKHFVEVDGVKLEVSLQEKLEFNKNGSDFYMIREGKLMIKPKPKLKTTYPVLTKAEKGYFFLDGDIHWPNKIDNGGQAWLIEYE